MVRSKLRGKGGGTTRCTERAARPMMLELEEAAAPLGPHLPFKILFQGGPSGRRAVPRPFPDRMVLGGEAGAAHSGRLGHWQGRPSIGGSPGSVEGPTAALRWAACPGEGKVETMVGPGPSRSGP
jgi:hypothetical protein